MVGEHFFRWGKVPSVCPDVVAFQIVSARECGI
jgi:hypothetical protein